mmetsp:Transcript_35413/g.75413  ORF Transcript_35413/g.75413 Transcript_35413/m.75413 type:complete len:209 (+) Transcript_35413:336-962(+)
MTWCRRQTARRPARPRSRMWRGGRRRRLPDGPYGPRPPPRACKSRWLERRRKPGLASPRRPRRRSQWSGASRRRGCRARSHAASAASRKGPRRPPQKYRRRARRLSTQPRSCRARARRSLPRPKRQARRRRRRLERRRHLRRERRRTSFPRRVRACPASQPLRCRLQSWRSSAASFLQVSSSSPCLSPSFPCSRSRRRSLRSSSLSGQ